MKKVGLTGGIGSGKSTVCRVFSLLGVPVYDSDKQARRLMEEEPELRNAIIRLFSQEAYTPQGVNRALIAQQVFSDPQRLAALNAQVHPFVAVDFARWAEKQKAPYVIQESAILFEAGVDRQMNYTVAVTAPEALRIHRTSLRDNTSPEDVERRIRNQMSEQERTARADYILYADEQQLLIPQIISLHRKLQACPTL